MKRVWKYAIPIQPRFEIRMPDGSHVLSVGLQDGVPVFWALVDDEREYWLRPFCLLWTGTAITEGVGAYRGTFINPEDELVYHLFDWPTVDERDSERYR
jgi:hypothetical protein